MRPSARTAPRRRIAVAVLAVGAGLLIAPTSGGAEPAITVSPAEVTATHELGTAGTATITITNTGDADKQVTIAEAPTGSGPASATAADATRPTVVPGPTNAHRLTAADAAQAARHATDRDAAAGPAATAPWTTAADFPVPIMDNLVAANGDRLFSVGGVSNAVMIADAYALDTEQGSWTTLSPMSQPREMPAGAFIDGRLYVAGGWSSTGSPVADVEVYDPASDIWSQAAPNPVPLAASASAVLDGRLYLVGGCDQVSCGSTAVQVYEPATDSWDAAAPYPEPIAWSACGAIDGKLYCAGGMSDATGVSTSTHVYTPATDSWARTAAMPQGLWGSGYTAANGQLLVSGGDNGDGITDAGFSFTAASGTWSELPPSGEPVRRGGSACGFYRVGGSTGDFTGTAAVALLPGYDACGGDTAWLTVDPTYFMLPAGQSREVAVGMDSAGLEQPGTYRATLRIGTADGDAIDPVPVTMTVTAPQDWGTLTGSIADGCATTSPPLDGASVTIIGTDSRTTLRTGPDGSYRWSMSEDHNPVTIIASKDGWRAQTGEVRIRPGRTTDVSFALRSYPSCGR